MTKDRTTLWDYQSYWEKLVDKGFNDYNSLTLDERIWYNIETLIGQVNNGGLISFYYSYPKRINETIDDLKKIGFDDVAGLMVQINNLFLNEQPSSNVNKISEVISNWPEGKYDNLLDQLDKYFYSKCNDLEDKLIQHIQNRGLDK